MLHNHNYLTEILFRIPAKADTTHLSIIDSGRFALVGWKFQGPQSLVRSWSAATVVVHSYTIWSGLQPLPQLVVQL